MKSWVFLRSCAISGTKYPCCDSQQICKKKYPTQKSEKKNLAVLWFLQKILHFKSIKKTLPDKYQVAIVESANSESTIALALLRGFCRLHKPAGMFNLQNAFWAYLSSQNIMQCITAYDWSQNTFTKALNYTVENLHESTRNKKPRCTVHIVQLRTMLPGRYEYSRVRGDGTTLDTNSFTEILPSPFLSNRCSSCFFTPSEIFCLKIFSTVTAGSHAGVGVFKT